LSNQELDHMKITNLKIAIGVAGLLGLGGMAQAVVPVEPTETYMFTAYPDNTTIFNGSTITIDGTGWGGVVSFDFLDSDLGDGSTDYTWGFIKKDWICSYDSTGWSGKFEVLVPLAPIPELASIGSSDFAEFTATGDSMDEKTKYCGEYYGDPFAAGTWTPVPDASSTFPMLLGVLAMLAGIHYCNRPPVLALARY
jgi:hypothetical protein